MDDDGDTHRLEVTLLGELRVRRDGAPVEVPGSRLRGLLALLALSAGGPVDAGGLVAALWPEVLPADPANALQSLVSRLRRALGSAEVVVQTDGGYRLAAAPDDVDVHQVERLAAAGRARLRAGEAEAARDLLTRAVALCRGPVAAEVAAVAPAVGVRIEHACTGAAADLAEAELRLGRYLEAGARLPALLAEHPLDERLGGLLMDALAGQGREADALAVYERIRHDLAEELGVDPGAALRERHLRLLHEPAPALSRRAGAASTGNLPAPVTSFVGRAEELARVDTLLAARRLVTIIGPGGAGKTRLALEAARRRRERHRDGTWLVDLAPVTEPAEVSVAIGSVFDLRGTAMFDLPGGRPDARDMLALLVERLAAREALLVIDNCEHLVEAAAEVTAALLRRCPQLRIVATSREPLAVDGEALVPLAPLPLPPADADLGLAARAPAVQLFAERAAAVAPDFALDATAVPDIVEVVRRLDGLPLALELAAARLRTLPLPELASGLSDRFRLLTGGSRTALPRHRTLRAVIAWSWDLLSPEERTVAECVSVLPAGATPASAAAVCAGTGVPPERIPDLLGALVDRSLLRLAGAGPRYRMLETLREYGIERLVERDELSGARERAARHVQALVARLEPALRTADQLPAMRTLRAEYDNALAGLRHLSESGDRAAALRLALDLCWYWQMLGQHSEAAFWLREVLSQPGDADATLLEQARALHLLSQWIVDDSFGSTPTDETGQQLRALAAGLTAHDDLRGPVAVLGAMALWFAGDAPAARARLDRAAEVDDPWLAAFARLFRARIAENAGDLAQVRRDAHAAMAGFRALGDRWGQAVSLPMRALIRQYDGDLDGALADLDAAAALSTELGSLDVNDEIFLRLRRSDLHLRRGEAGRAADALAEARSLARRSPSLRALVDALEAGLHVRRGDLDRAERLMQDAEQGLVGDAGRSALSGDHGTAILGALRAALAVAQGEPDVAARALAVAYPAAVASNDLPILGLVGVGAADVLAARGEYHESAMLLSAAARLRGAEDPTDLTVARLTHAGRAALGDEGFEAAYAAGWSLDTHTARTRVDPSGRPGLTAIEPPHARRA